jgi:hypothetical protein
MITASLNATSWPSGRMARWNLTAAGRDNGPRKNLGFHCESSADRATPARARIKPQVSRGILESGIGRFIGLTLDGGSCGKSLRVIMEFPFGLSACPKQPGYILQQHSLAVDPAGQSSGLYFTHLTRPVHENRHFRQPTKTANSVGRRRSLPPSHIAPRLCHKRLLQIYSKILCW